MPRHSSRTPSPRRGRSPDRRDSRRGDRPFAKKPVVSKNEEQISIFVRNLSPNTKEAELQDKFQQFGNLKDVYIPRFYQSGEPRGFAYIQYSSMEDANRAIKEMDGATVDGRTISVTFAQGKRKTPQEMKYKTKGGRRSPSPRGRRYSPYSRGRRYSPYRRGRRSPSYSPHRSYSRSYSRSYTPSPRRGGRDRSRKSSVSPRRSPRRGNSPRRSSRRSPRRSMDRARSPPRRSSPGERDRSPPRRSPPQRDASPPRSRRSISPRDNGNNDRSPRDSPRASDNNNNGASNELEP